MAIFHLHHDYLSRSEGHSAVAAAAYRAGEKLTDYRDGKVFDYSHKSGVMHREIMTPGNAAAWMSDREKLWNEVERLEDQSTRRATAQLAHSFDLALPHEMGDEECLQQWKFLVRDFIRETFTRHGYVADWVIHAPSGKGDSRNYHVHILVPLRPVEADGLAKKKPREWHNYDERLKQWREQWSNLCNRHLQRWGHKDRVDHRSFKDRGVKKFRPTIHVGKVAIHLERKGLKTWRGSYNLKIKVRNSFIRAASSRDGKGEGALGSLTKMLFKGFSLQAVASEVAKPSEAHQSQQWRGVLAKSSADQGPERRRRNLYIAVNRRRYG